MNDVRQAALAFLLADPATSAVVGARAFPLVIPEGAARPALAYRVAQNVRDHDLLGPTGTSWAQFRFDVETRRYADCPAAVLAIRNLFDGFAGPMPGAGGVEVLETSLDSEEDVAEAPDDATGVYTFRTGVDVLIHYREAKPPLVPYLPAGSPATPYASPVRPYSYFSPSLFP